MKTRSGRNTVKNRETLVVAGILLLIVTLIVGVRVGSALDGLDAFNYRREYFQLWTIEREVFAKGAFGIAKERSVWFISVPTRHGKMLQIGSHESLDKALIQAIFGAIPCA